MAKGGSKGNQKPVRDYGSGARPNNGATPATWQQHYGNGYPSRALMQGRMQDRNQQQGMPMVETGVPANMGPGSGGAPVSLGMPAPGPGIKDTPNPSLDELPAVQPVMPPAPGQPTERDAYRDAMRDRMRGRFQDRYQDRNGPQSPQTPEQQGYTGLPADGSAPPMGYNGPPMQGIQGYTGPNGGQQSGQGMSGQALRDWWNQRRGNNGGGQQPLSGQPLRNWWNQRGR